MSPRIVEEAREKGTKLVPKVIQKLILWAGVAKETKMAGIFSRDRKNSTTVVYLAKDWVDPNAVGGD